jgi:hypothetical protein
MNTGNNNFKSLVWQQRRVPHGVLTDEFVQRFDRYIDWPLLSRNYGLDMPIDMIRIYQHRLIWTTLLTFRLFPENVLREMSINFDDDCWQVISMHQRLSESFIHEYADKVDWELIVKYQTVSERFLTEHKNYRVESNDESAIANCAARSV